MFRAHRKEDLKPSCSEEKSPLTLVPSIHEEKLDINLQKLDIVIRNLLENPFIVWEEAFDIDAIKYWKIVKYEFCVRQFKGI